MKPVLRALRLVSLCAIASVALYGASCSDGGSGGSGGTGGDAENPALEGIVYEGETTDEALEELIAAQPKDDPSQKAAFDWPKDGDVLPASPIPTFAWHPGASARLDLRLNPIAPPARHAVRSPFSELFGPERSAHAHGAPFNGTGYFVVFSTDKNDKLVRVFTGNTSYKPDATSWKALQDAKAAIKVSITSGIFDNNALASDGGPFKGESITITVAQ